MPMTRPALAAALLATATMLAGCGQEPMLRADQAWVRLAPTPDRPSVAYFTLHGGTEDARLINVTSSVAIRTEMHDMSHEGGVMRMRPIEGGVTVPARGQVAFAPGGKHVMIYNINPGITPARTVPLLFTFADGMRVQANASVQAAGAAPPAH